MDTRDQHSSTGHAEASRHEDEPRSTQTVPGQASGAGDEPAELTARLVALIDNSDDFILFSDANGAPLFFNKAYAAVMKQLLGIEMKPGIKPHELLEDEQAKAAWDAHHRRVLAGERFSVDYCHPLEDGSDQHFEIVFNPIRKEDRVIGFSETTRDVTARKKGEMAQREAQAQLEEQVLANTRALERTNEVLKKEIAQRERAVLDLQASETRFRELAERAPDLTAIIDRDGTYRYVCPAVRQFGFEPREIVGRAPRDVVHPEDIPAVESDIQQAISQPGVATLMRDFRVRHKSGEISWLEGIVTCLWNVTGVDGIVFNGRDVTERRRLQERLRHSEKMEAIGQLAGGVAHDFNNQLAGVIGYAELLLRRLSDPKLQTFAHEVVKAAQRAADLTQQLLAFARKGPPKTSPVDLHQTVSDVASLLERSVDRRIVIEQKLAAPTAVTRGDSSLLNSALLNLALNARDAMPEGGTLTFRSDVVLVVGNERVDINYALPPGSYVMVSVADTGVGMDESTVDRMFEPFFTTKELGDGNGMGLASVYGTVRSHGGALQVESSLGRGTCVHLYLPLDSSPQKAPSQSATKSHEASGARIMLVEDEDAVRGVMTEIIHELGSEATPFGDSLKALKHYGTSWRDYDLVILDLVMPSTGGKDVFDELRKINPQARVLLCSGYGRTSDIGTLLEQGAVGLLQKPFRAAELATAIEHALER